MWCFWSPSSETGLVVHLAGAGAQVSCHGSRWRTGSTEPPPGDRPKLDHVPVDEVVWGGGGRGGRGGRSTRRLTGSWLSCRCWPRTRRRGRASSQPVSEMAPATLAAVVIRRPLQARAGPPPAGHGGRRRARRRRGRGAGGGRVHGGLRSLCRRSGRDVVDRAPPASENPGTSERAREAFADPQVLALALLIAARPSPALQATTTSSTPAAARRRRLGPSGSTQAGSRGASTLAVNSTPAPPPRPRPAPHREESLHVSLERVHVHALGQLPASRAILGPLAPTTIGQGGIGVVTPRGPSRLAQRPGERGLAGPQRTEEGDRLGHPGPAVGGTVLLQVEHRHLDREGRRLAGPCAQAEAESAARQRLQRRGGGGEVCSRTGLRRWRPAVRLCTRSVTAAMAPSADHTSRQWSAPSTAQPGGRSTRQSRTRPPPPAGPLRAAGVRRHPAGFRERPVVTVRSRPNSS